MGIKLNIETDLDLDLDDLKNEFRRIGPLIYAYCEIKANAHEAADIAKAEHEELRSKKYLEFRQREGKITEATLDAMINTDEDVIKALRNWLAAKKDFETISGYVEGLEANKDMLMQLGADARKERD